MKQENQNKLEFLKLLNKTFKQFPNSKKQLKTRKQIKKFFNN